MFIDDILVYSKTLHEHEEHLKTALQVLKDNQYYAKLSKCQFWASEILFLGHIINTQGLSVELEKVKVVMGGNA